MSKLHAISKSQQAEMRCEWHFAQYRLAGQQVLRRVSTPNTDVGKVFHSYRATYITHLLGVQSDTDPAWVQAWIRGNVMTSAARELIERDALRFAIDPQNVLGTEVYLSVDEGFEPLDMQTEATYENTQRTRGALAEGYVDLLIVSGSTAFPIDYKTSFHVPSEPEEYEPASYAALIFAHLPYVDTVVFAWDYVRSGAQVELEYPRGAFEGLKDLVRYEHKRREDIAARFFAGEKLQINPYSGLCGRCEIDCPLRVEARSPLVAGPIQNEDDAREIAARIQAGDSAMSKYRQALKLWLSEHGKVSIPGGFEAEVVPGVDLTVSADQVERLSEKWDFEARGVALSMTDLKRYAKTRKRNGMMQELYQIGKKTPKSDLRIRKVGEAAEGEAA